MFTTWLVMAYLFSTYIKYRFVFLMLLLKTHLNDGIFVSLKVHIAYIMFKSLG